MDIDIARGSRALSLTPSMPAASAKQSVQYHSPCRRSRNCNATAASGPSATMLLIAPLLDPRKGSDTLSRGDPRTGPFVTARRYLGFPLTRRMVFPDLWSEGSRPPISGISGTQVFLEPSRVTLRSREPRKTCVPEIPEIGGREPSDHKSGKTILRVSGNPKYLLAVTKGPVLGSPLDRVSDPFLGSRRGAMSSMVALGPEAAVALQFLDRRQGEWYCTDCLADAAGIDGVNERALDPLAMSMSMQAASAAGYRSKVDGPCTICDGRRPRAAGLKGYWSVQSLGK